MNLYNVYASVPQDGLRWRKNLNIRIACESLPRATEIFLLKHPDADIHQIINRGSVDVIDSGSAS